VLGPESPVWKALAATIEGRVTAEEDRLTKLALMGGWKHPNEPEERGRTRVEVQALYRTPVGEGRFLYFYEAVKRYTLKDVPLRAGDAPKREQPRRPGEDCSVLTFANGWFVAGNTDTTLDVPDPNVRLVSCDFAEADVMLPLGYVSGEQGPTWVVQMSGWGREQFALLSWDSATRAVRALFTVHGGECPRVR
jgi:hypothetical protein